MTSPVALLVDDEPDILELLSLTLDKMGIKVVAVGDCRRACEALKQQRFDVCLTDMRLPDGNGIDLVKLIQQDYPDTPVAVITAYGNMELAITALKAGAFDFLSKPVDLKILRDLIQTVLRLTERGDETDDAATQALIGVSPQIQAVREKVRKLARSQAPVLITGESGTGKELVAGLIHAMGPRAAAAFVPVNCGAIPEHLVESELFGHKKGSFTGAHADKTGLFQAAHGGTLLLDEVADLPLTMQVKLLRAIQEKAVRPVGSHAEVSVDVRIVSATNEHLQQLVNDAQFRQDLFYRINVIEVHVPPLRERTDDIPILAEHKLQALAKQNGVPFPSIDEAAMNALRHYDFPGNVRELENILERAMTLCENNTIRPADLHLGELSGDTTPSDLDNMALDSYLGEVERQRILDALERSEGNRASAAKLLGISLRALRYRLQKLGIDS